MTLSDPVTVELGSMTVHRLGFGTMQLTGPGVWGPPRDRGAAIRVLRAAVDLGVDLIDTADAYGPNVAEDLIREALHPYPSHLKIATKVGFTRPGPDLWLECGRADYLRRQCEGSLRRLGVECLDLLQLHRVDPAVPADDQFATLAALRAEGKVAEVGLSQVDVPQIEAARRFAPVVSVQNHYNLAHREADRVVDYCEREGIAFIPWFPLDSGKLTRPGGPLDEVAKQLEASPSQVCLAWLLRRSAVMLPIPGTTSVNHLEENCAARELILSGDQYDTLANARKLLRRWSLRG
jgi:pyridoxine 4-dehydrogenase